MAKPKENVGEPRMRIILGLKKRELQKLVEQGLPVNSNGTFNKAKCLDWCKKNIAIDRADAADTIVISRAKIAAHMGVKETSVRYYEKHAHENGFPGRLGHYPLRACLQWHEEFQSSPSSAGAPSRPRSDADNKITDLKAQKLETEVRKQRGELIDIESVAGWIRRSVARQKEIMRSFPDRLAKLLQEHNLDAKVVSFCRHEASKAIDELQVMIQSDLIEHAEEDLAK